MPNPEFNEQSDQSILRDDNEKPFILNSGGQELASVHEYEYAENFQQGVALLRDKIVRYLTENENKSIIVAMAGKTGSGKTTITNELRQILADFKFEAKIISTDDFYLPNSEELDLEKLHTAIEELKQGQSSEGNAPVRAILVEGLQVIEDKTIGQKPDVRAYITVPADKRFAGRLLRDAQIGFRSVKESLIKLTELTPETVAAIQKFEADHSMRGVDVVVNNDRENPNEPELYILGDTLVLSVPGGMTEKAKIAPDRISFLEQLGIKRR